MKSKYSVLVFDLGNVLIPFDYSLVTAKLETYESGLGKQFKDMYYENYHVHRAYEKNEMTTDEFLKINLGWIDNKVTEEEFIEAYCGLFSENNKLTSLLPIFKNDYKIVALSNTNFLHQKYGWNKYDFIKHFDKMILSHEVGYYKPEPGIYKAVENYTQEPADKHFFIDDVEEYVEGAKRRGWGGHQYLDHDQYLGKMKELGILE